MKNKNYLLLLLIPFLFTSCGPSREKSVKEINAMEKRLFSPNSTSFDKAKWDSLIAKYEAFSKRFPDDSLVPAYTFNAANIAMNMNDGQKALALFEQIITKYPNYKKAPLCLFFKGYVYENLLHDLGKAKENYLAFIEKYPNNEFVSAAQASIQNLGKSPEQMVKEFEAKRQADSARVADSLAKVKGKKLKHGKG
jgi:outer membrane protein assembly factor BamD (BamD/ComL family)